MELDSAVIYSLLRGPMGGRALSENDHDRGRQRQQTGAENTIVLPERTPVEILGAADAPLPHPRRGRAFARSERTHCGENSDIDDGQDRRGIQKMNVRPPKYDIAEEQCQAAQRA